MWEMSPSTREVAAVLGPGRDQGREVDQDLEAVPGRAVILGVGHGVAAGRGVEVDQGHAVGRPCPGIQGEVRDPFPGQGPEVDLLEVVAGVAVEAGVAAEVEAGVEVDQDPYPEADPGLDLQSINRQTKERFCPTLRTKEPHP